jgi:hypothetical protein
MEKTEKHFLGPSRKISMPLIKSSRVCARKMKKQNVNKGTGRCYFPENSAAKISVSD